MTWFKQNSATKQAAIGFVVAGLVLGGAAGVLADRAWLAPAAVRQATGTGQVSGVGQAPPSDLALQDVDFKQFWDLWQMLKEKYYQQPVKDKDLFYGSMEGMAASLGDPYTEFFEPTSAADFEASLSGKFEGIGAEIGEKDNALTVIAPLPDTPASRAGILAGDIIVRINGEDTSGMTVDAAVSKIRGPKGTKVTLTIYRASSKKPPQDITIVRDVIQVKNITWKMLSGGIAYLDVADFDADTTGEFTQAVTQILKQDPKGFILDLRGNPGGYLDAAVDMAGAWVGDSVVVKERRQGKITDEYQGTGRKRLSGIPTIVLVDGGSASASEIVAGALQDDKAATLVGVKTFGKGSVQEFSQLPDGSAVKITVAEWLTPNGRTINKTGLDPDVVVNMTQEDYDAKRDPQLDRAVGILNGTATSTPAAPTSTRP